MVDQKEEKQMATKSESLIKSHKDHPEVWAVANRKSSETKRSPDGHKRLVDALNKCKDQLRSQKGKKPHNYIPEALKPKVICRNCGKVRIVTPTVAKTRHYCNTTCMNEYRTGKPMKNWNPNSFHGKSGRGVCGTYKSILFRSTLELSFIIWSLKNGHKVVSEPFCIRVKDYLTHNQQMEFSEVFNENTKHTPDFLINDKQLIQVKPEKFLVNMDAKVHMNLRVTDNYCTKHYLEFGVVTDETLKECLLTDKQIREIPKEDITFFREKHKVKYGER